MDEYAEVPLSLALEVGLLTDAAWERASLDPKYQSDAAQQLSDMMKDMRFLKPPSSGSHRRWTISQLRRDSGRSKTHARMIA